jgi:hypothetical protein
MKTKSAKEQSIKESKIVPRLKHDKMIISWTEYMSISSSEKGT